MDAQQQIEGLYQQHSMLIEEYKKLEKLLADTKINLSTVEQVNAELLEASNELLKAIEQKHFFLNGYANGSASISEAKAAMADEDKAYSKLWNLTKFITL